MVANDIDAGRSFILAHNTQALNSPALLITSHNALLFPTLWKKTQKSAKRFKFDRILCDVPCSCSATLRKQPDIWRKYRFDTARAIHTLQIGILTRALELLKEGKKKENLIFKGGRAIYSTCSFDVLENEAVLCEVIKRYKEKDKDYEIEIVDLQKEIPAGLVYSPGFVKCI